MTYLSSLKLVSTSEWIKSSWLPPTSKHKSRDSRKETVFPALKRFDASAVKCRWQRRANERTTYYKGRSLGLHSADRSVDYGIACASSPNSQPCIPSPLVFNFPVCETS